MKRISLGGLFGIGLAAMLTVIVLDKGNVLRLDDSIEGLIWSVIFPVFLLISFVLVVWAYRTSERDRATKAVTFVAQSTRRSGDWRKFLNKDISSTKTTRIIGAALLVVVAPVIFSATAPIVIGTYVNYTANNPIVVVANQWAVEYRKSSSKGIPVNCSGYIKIRNYEDFNFRSYCIKRPFGLPVIKTIPVLKTKSFNADSGFLCIQGRESSVGAVVDQIVIIRDESLNIDAKQLRCAQLFSDTKASVDIDV